MALSGQVVEAFVMMRSCLEYAGYALVIFHDPAQEAVFMERHVSAEGMRAQKEKFRISEVRSVISSFDTRLAEQFQVLYERSIDFGGHPNPHAVVSAVAVEMSERAIKNSYTSMALTADRQALLHAMKSVAQVGLAALFIFQHVFKARFELLGIREEMSKLRKENL